MSQTKLTDYYSVILNNSITQYFDGWYAYFFKNSYNKNEDNIELNNILYQKRMTDYYNVLDKV
mgnify:FL=1|jgi:hypothetical protein